MKAKTALAGAAALLASGCQLIMDPKAANRHAGAASVGAALARATCPLHIQEAQAWINRMPAPASTDRNAPELNVLVSPAQESETGLLLKSPTQFPGALVLEIRNADASTVPGRLVYKETAPDPLYDHVVLMCRGGVIHRIETIDRVY